MTASTTSTVFAPDCLRIDSTTAGLPSMLAAVSASSSPSSTVPTSRTRMGWPSTLRTTMSPIACTLVTRPLTRNVSRCGPVSTAPPGAADVLRDDRALDVDGGQAGGAQPRRVELDVDLALAPADDRHLADAADVLERLPHLVSANSVTSRMRPRRLHRQEQHRRRVRIELGDRRALGPLGQIGRHHATRARAPPARRRRCPCRARS